MSERCPWLLARNHNDLPCEWCIGHADDVRDALTNLRAAIGQRWDAEKAAEDNDQRLPTPEYQAAALREQYAEAALIATVLRHTDRVITTHA